MKIKLLAVSVVIAMGVASTTASAGCLKGAVVGGVAGHVAGKDAAGTIVRAACGVVATRLVLGALCHRVVDDLVLQGLALVKDDRVW